MPNENDKKVPTPRQPVSSVRRAPAPKPRRQGPPRKSAPRKAAPSQPRAPMSPTMRLVLLIAGGVVVLFLATWIIGIVHFSGHFLPHTYASGQEISGLTASEAEERASLANWKLRIVEGDNEWFLSSKELGLTVEDVSFDDMLKRQNTFAWPGSFFNSSARNDIQQSMTYDPEAVKKAVAALPFVNDPNRASKTDATAKLADDKRSFVLVTEGIGSKVDVDRLTQMVLSELESFEKAGEGDKKEAEFTLPVDANGVPTIDLVTTDCYLHPETTSDNVSLQDAVNKANQWLKTEVTYTIDGIEGAEVVNADLISTWVTIDRTDNVAKIDTEGATTTSASDQATFDAVLHEDKVRSWLATIGKKYDTVFCGKDITPANGQTRFVPGGQSYGWMTDESTEFKQLTSDILAGNVVSRAFATKQEGKTPVAKFNEKYLEVSIDDQHIYLFENGKIVWDARTVTGSPWAPTITGTFAIYAMQRDAILLGPDEDEDGSPDYESQVSYWMPFSGGYGLHDATTWRGDDPEEYGEGVRYSNGSHGCCNLTGPDAEYLYEHSYVGMTVYVHEEGNDQ